MLYRVPLFFNPQPEGGFTVTSPALPELISEGETLDEAYANAHNALDAVIELYADQGRTVPSTLTLRSDGEPVWSDVLVETP
ncbi:MAG: type II toxin-antitoxin system HicB family antitoxin [Pirellulales bacterium]